MKVKFRGYLFDDRTVAMVKYAEKLAGFKFDVSQGSYNKGGVAASAGTHDGGGVVDFSVKEMDALDIRRMLKALKDTGFAAWHRRIRPGVWSAHVHAVAIGCPDLAPIAKRQVTAFDAGKDGLASNEKDPSYRPNPAVKFDQVSGRPVIRKKTVAAKARNAVVLKRVK